MSAVLLLLAALAGCKPVAPAGPVTVFAASSLSDALPRVAAAWSAQGHPEPVFSFGASSTLGRQIVAGAPADLYIAADEEWMDALEAEGAVAAGSRVDLLGNRLVVVVPAGTPRVINTAADLAAPGIRHLGVASNSVPAGMYARLALGKLGVWDAVQARAVNGDNVRTVLGWVATGEVEAGVVYATDAQAEPRVATAFTFPADSHPPIVYPGAVLRHAAQAEEAASLLAWCQGPEATAIWRAAGFLVPPDAP